jgi:hypothetical protein
MCGFTLSFAAVHKTGLLDTTSLHADPKNQLFQAHTGGLWMSMPSVRPRNQLLACLPEADWLRLMPLLSKVALPAGETLIESGASFSHVYFSLDGLVALHGQIENGAVLTFVDISIAKALEFRLREAH